MKKDKAVIIQRKMKDIMDISRTRMLENLEGFGITPSQAMVMGVVMKKNNPKISDISECLSLSNATVSGIVDRLEKQKKVIKTKDEKDKRVVYVTINETFKKQLKKQHTSPTNCIVKPLLGATNEEMDNILKGLTLLENVLIRKEENND